MLRFIDVSMMITEDMIVYPGNPHPVIQRYSSIQEKKTDESLISIGSHTGTHADAKMHIQENREGAAAIPLSSFYGRCRVIDLTAVEKEIHRRDLENKPIKRGDIILLKTRNSEQGYNQFRSDYTHVKIDAATYLVEKGVKTLGFDYLSVKKFEGDDEVHNMLINNLTLFEGLNLAGVAEGEYIFLGLPLRINCDGAPARIILIEE